MLCSPHPAPLQPPTPELAAQREEGRELERHKGERGRKEGKGKQSVLSASSGSFPFAVTGCDTSAQVLQLASWLPWGHAAPCIAALHSSFPPCNLGFGLGLPFPSCQLLVVALNPVHPTSCPWGQDKSTAPSLGVAFPAWLAPSHTTPCPCLSHRSCQGRRRESISLNWLSCSAVGCAFPNECLCCF